MEFQIGYMKVELNISFTYLKIKKIYIIFFFYISEEVFGSGSALWISANGRKLCFAQFNDTLVPETLYLHYGTPAEQYPTEVKIRYPKVGVTNPTVSLSWLELPDSENSLPPEIHNLDLPTGLRYIFYELKISS